MNQNWIVAINGWLWALPLLAAGGVGLWFLWRRIVHGRLQRFVAPRHFGAAMPRVNWIHRGVQFALAVMVLMLLAFSLARPLRGPTAEHAESKGIDFVLALDVSKSMWVEDVAPNRLAAVKKELGEWIGKMHGDRMGLVLFAGDAMVQAPITFDYTALNLVLQQAGPRSISYGGTNIPKAVEMATHLLQNAEPRSRILVIVSDGENLEGDATDAVRQARIKDGLTVFTVGVGTLQGGRVPDADYSTKTGAEAIPARNKRYVRNEYGTGVTSRLDSRSLRLLAEAGGGRYYDFKPGTKVFETLQTQGLQPLAQKNQKIDVREYQEWFQLPLGLAILLMVAVPLVSLVRKRPAATGAGVEVVMPDTLSKPTGPRTFIRARKAASVRAAAGVGVTCLLIALTAAPAVAVPAVNSPWEEAEKLLAADKKDEAVRFMREQVDKDGKDPYLFYNYALTLYRAGKHEEAIAAFQALRQSTDLKDLQDKAALQMGNAQVRLGEALKKNWQLSGAILSLERALSHYDETPGDNASREVKNNRQVAIARLESYLLEAGTKYRSQADSQKANLSEEEQNLRNALQAYERVTEINQKNTDAAKTAQELRERLAQNLSKQAQALTQQADAVPEKDPKESKGKPDTAMTKLHQAVAKLDDALTVTPENKPIEKQRQEVQNKISNLLTNAAEKQMAKPMEKARLDDKDQKEVTEAKAKLEEAMALNTENQKAQDLHKQASEKLEQSHVERGQQALDAADKNKTNPQNKLAQLSKAADQFQKALENNAKSEPAKKGLQEANAKLPEAFADAGDAEAGKAQEAMNGKPPAPGQSTQNMQKAVGFLEKANQNYGMALSMQPQNASIQKRADAVQEMLAAARDQLDQQNRQNMEADAGQPGQEGQPMPGESETANDTTRKVMSMADLAGKAKPNTGDNFWERQPRDW